MNTWPSRAYRLALEQATRHHLESKTYSGKFLRPHAPIIKRLIEQTGATALLDYGCGKGSQYTWVSHGDDASIPEGMTIEQFWGIDVRKYDPATVEYWKPTPEEMLGDQREQFDITLVTHVLGSIPIGDLTGWVLPRLARLTKDAVYIAEKIGEVGKQVFDDTAAMPRWEAPYWQGFIQGASVCFPKVAWYISTHERTPAGKIMTLRGFKDGEEFNMQHIDKLLGAD